MVVVIFCAFLEPSFCFGSELQPVVTKPVQRKRVDSYTDSLDMPLDMVPPSMPPNSELEQMLSDLEKTVNGEKITGSIIHD